MGNSIAGLAAGIALAVLGTSTASAATLIGDTTHAVSSYPNTATLLEDIGTQVVGASTPAFPDILGAGLQPPGPRPAPTQAGLRDGLIR